MFVWPKLYHEAEAESGYSGEKSVVVTLDRFDFKLLYCAPMVDSLSSIYELLAARVAQAPDKIFLAASSDGREFTYAEFAAAVDRAASLLAASGIGKGDVVSLLMPNSAEYIIAYFACWKIGALAGPVNSLLKEHEIEFVMNNSEAKAILVHSEFQPTIETIRTGLPHLRVIVSFDDEAEATRPCQKPDRQGGPVSQDALPDGRASDTISPDDDAIIIYTSGTTGKPKGCLLTHGNLFAKGRRISQWLSFRKNDRLLTIMPLFHMNAVSVTTMSALYAGASTVISPKFSAKKFWQIISDTKSRRLAQSRPCCR